MQERFHGSEVLHSMEGPQQRIEVQLDKNEYLEHCYPQVPSPWEYVDWFNEQLIAKMPEGMLKTAMELSTKEHRARIARVNDEQGGEYNLYDTQPLCEGSNQFAFRGVIRRSDGGPLDEEFYPDATMEALDENIFAHGIEYLGRDSVHSINPNYAIPRFCIPNQMEVKRGENVSVIQVYRNEPFIVQLPQDASVDTGEQMVLLVDINNAGEYGRSQQISLTEAKERDLPTLRDLFLGQIVTTIA